MRITGKTFSIPANFAAEVIEIVFVEAMAAAISAAIAAHEGI